ATAAPSSILQLASPIWLQLSRLLPSNSTIQPASAWARAGCDIAQPTICMVRAIFYEEFALLGKFRIRCSRHLLHRCQKLGVVFLCCVFSSIPLLHTHLMGNHSPHIPALGVFQLAACPHFEAERDRIELRPTKLAAPAASCFPSTRVTRRLNR